MFKKSENYNTNIGDIMKKVLMIFTIVLIILISFFKKEEVLTVFNYSSEYEIYYLDFRCTDLNTNNFMNYFSDIDIDIIKIKPYINPLYKANFKNKEYIFDYKSNISNLNSFKDKYLEELKSINYEEYTFNKINGIKIDMVKVYANNSSIKKIQQFDKNVKYMFKYNDYINI